MRRFKNNIAVLFQTPSAAKHHRQFQFSINESKPNLKLESRYNIPNETNTKTTLGDFSFYGQLKSTEEDNKEQELKQFEVGSFLTKPAMHNKIPQTRKAANEVKDLVGSFAKIDLKDSLQDHNKSNFNYKKVFNNSGTYQPDTPAAGFLPIPQVRAIPQSSQQVENRKKIIENFKSVCLFY